MDEALARAGIEALRRGDGRTALDCLSRCVDDEAETPWLALAQAHQLLGDAGGEAEALEKLLAREPRNLTGLLLMAALQLRTGEERAAGSFYQIALRQAAEMDEVPAQLQPLLQQGEAFMAGQQDRYADHLIDHLTKAGFGKPAGRVAQAMDLLLGRTRLYVQEPSSFYFPGLPQRHFYEREEFDWLAGLESAVPTMQAELQAIMAEDQGFSPYIHSAPGRPLPTNPLRDDPAWSAMYFWRNGDLQVSNAARAPQTVSALDKAPIPVIAGRSPMALYSRLEPGAHIQPHNGLLNTRLICHIPLIAPPDCSLRVGNETRGWEAGKALIFDDSIEHEAWNRSSETRIVLLFEIWRPEISDEERSALTVLFEAITDYGGAPMDQG